MILFIISFLWVICLFLLPDQDRDNWPGLLAWNPPPWNSYIIVRGGVSNLGSWVFNSSNLSVLNLSWRWTFTLMQGTCIRATICLSGCYNFSLRYHLLHLNFRFHMLILSNRSGICWNKEALRHLSSLEGILPSSFLSVSERYSKG